ncbi:MAG: nucleotidyltransferase domain-containing protein, partial [Actinomycetota bacterium]|nr:nucleotidyltransferase domain-containing protein [Actinomycetota bacterium]
MSPPALLGGDLPGSDAHGATRFVGSDLAGECAEASRVVDRRRGEQAAAFDIARRFAASLGAEIRLVAVVVFGSYARGDFNTWSDIDVLVVCDQLPADTRERSELLWRHHQAGVSAIGWTTVEHQA